jgi:tape measure domain-containing protein
MAATDTYLIVIRQQGAEETAKKIDGIAASAKKSADTLAFFRKALVALSAVRAVEGIVEFVDAAARISNTLRASTRSLDEFARAESFVYKLSRDTRTAVEANATVYGRLIRSTEGLGISTERLQKIQEALSLSIKVGGATSQEARNALVQFSQSLASGALRGDELRSVSEQLPGLARAIGKEFGVAGGSLIAFAKANPGILDTQRVLKGVEKALPQLRAQFAQLTPTMTEAFDVLKNSIIELFSRVQSSIGLFGLLSKAIIFLADNLQLIADVAPTIIAAFAVNKYQALIVSVYSATAGFIAMASAEGVATVATRALTAAIASNPIGFWATVVATAITSLILLYNTSDTAKSVMDGFFNVISTGLGYIGTFASAIVTFLTPAFEAVANVVSIAAEFIGGVLWSALTTVGDYIANQLGPSVAQLELFFQGVGNVISYLADGFVLLGEKVGPVWQILQDGAASIYQDLVSIRDAVDKMLAPIGGLNVVLSALTGYLNLLGGTIAVLVTGGIGVLVGAFDLLVNVLYSVGLVSQETASAVNDYTNQYIDMARALTTTTDWTKAFTDAAQQAADASHKGGAAAREYSGSLNQLGDSAQNATGKLQEFYLMAGEQSQTITGAQMLKNLDAIVIDTGSSFERAGGSAQAYGRNISSATASASASASANVYLAGSLDDVASGYISAASAANSYASAASSASGAARSDLTTSFTGRRFSFSGNLVGPQGNFNPFGSGDPLLAHLIGGAQNLTDGALSVYSSANYGLGAPGSGPGLYDMIKKMQQGGAYSNNLESSVKQLISTFQNSIKDQNTQDSYNRTDGKPSIQDQRPVLVQVSIATPNADSFRLSQDQINRGLASAIQGALNRS